MNTQQTNIGKKIVHKDVEAKHEVSRQLTQILEMISKLEAYEGNINIELTGADYHFDLTRAEILTPVKITVLKVLKDRARELELSLKNIGF